MTERPKRLFELGKATMRGVRKCRKCGTLNGTRAVSCKNKQCDVVFRPDHPNSRKQPDCVKLTCSASRVLYSVRQPERGPDIRGFVELFPVMYDVSTMLVFSGTARCFVESCCSSGGDQADTESIYISKDCIHTTAAISCKMNSQPLTVTDSAIDAIAGVTDEGRAALHKLISCEMNSGGDVDVAGDLADAAANTADPLVQRVSRHSFVVRSPYPCETGYEHVTLGSSHIPKKQKFHCSCQPTTSAASTQTAVMSYCCSKSVQRCIHFYAVMCAFLSDSKLAMEFEQYLLAVTSTLDYNQAVRAVINQVDMDPVDEDQQMLTLNGHEEEEAGETNLFDSVESVQFAELSPGGSTLLLPVDAIHNPTDILQSDADHINNLDFEGQPPAKQPRVDYFIVENGDTSICNGKFVSSVSADPSPTKLAPFNSRKIVVGADCATVFSFDDWLASVTEQISETMHYQFSGNPDPLVFLIPNKFFNLLQVRLASRKKRFPHTVTQVVRTDSPPLGTFVKYSWQLTNILHVKQVFDTPQRPLELMRCFVENHDGSYSACDPVTRSSDEATAAAEHLYSGRQCQPIRPTQLRTFIRLGATSHDFTPFIIEWMPDLLPKSHVGELRIIFHFGHERNGQIEPCPPPYS